MEVNMKDKTVLRYRFRLEEYTPGGQFVEAVELEGFHSERKAQNRFFGLLREAKERGMRLRMGPITPYMELLPVVYDGPPVRKHIVFHGNHTECDCCGRLLSPDEVLCRECF
jgi:hypothetical protein